MGNISELSSIKTVPFNELINFNYINLVTLILSFTLSFGVIWISRINQRTARLFNEFPGAPTIPLLGNAGLFLFCHPTEIPERIRECFKKYGGCFRFWRLGSPHLMVAHHKVAEKILSAPTNLNKGYKAIKIYFGDGLVTANGHKWRADRKQLSAGFKHTVFPKFLETFNRNAKLLMESLRNQFLEDEDAEKYKNLFSVFGQCTLNVVCEGALGDTTEEGGISKPYMFDMIVSVGKAMRARIYKPWLTLPGVWAFYGKDTIFEKARQDVISFINKKIQDRQYNNTDYESTPKSFLDILLESRRSAKDVMDHVITMLGAGTDTSASAINYTLYLLALNPEHQDLVRQELDSIFKNRNISAEEISFGDLAGMKYLEMCIKESLRLYPPVPMFSRRVSHDVHLENKLRIPKGCTVTIWPYELHRDPEIFPDPETFNPKRFTPEACSTRPAYSYIPFSAGARNCIGQKYAMAEVKVILAHILSTFEVKTINRREDLKLVYGIVLEPHGGIKLNFKYRF